MRILLIFLISVIYSWPTCSIEIPIIQKDTINFQTLKLIHNVNHARKTRRIYLDPDSRTYYKIWDKDYVLAPDFLNAVQAGFFKKTTHLLALIFDENYCCGYIILEGKSIHSLPIVLEKYSRGYVRFAPLEEQTYIPFLDFYDRLLTVSKETNYAFIDLTPTNIVESNNELFLIDLESVRKISSLKNDFFNNKHLPYDYRKAIAHIKGIEITELNKHTKQINPQKRNKYD